MDTPKIRQALQTLAPYIDAFGVLYRNVEDFSKVETQTEAAQQNLDQLKSKADEAVRIKAEAQANRDRCNAELIETRKQITDLQTKSKADAEEIIASARRDAINAADQIKASREDQLKGVLTDIDKANEELQQVKALISQARGEHDQVLASINSLKTRLGG